MQLIRSHSSKSLQAILIIVLISAVTACSESRDGNGTTAAKALKSESFTFFDLGRNSQLNKQVRQELGRKLGRDAIEHRSIMELEINYDGFLEKYFPVLDELNRKLNFPPGERVEHDTVKLMYRYAARANAPFDYVELVYSNYTQTPVLFRIHFRADQAGIVNTLEAKYGQPRIADWKEENGRSMYWLKNGDYLIVSLVPDQFGNHSYQIVIYFVDNLDQLAATERDEQREKLLERTRSGKTAF